MEVFLFCTMIAAVFGTGFEFGQYYMCVKNFNLRQENQQLKQILTDMQRIEELSFKAYCAMTRESAYKRPQSQPDPSTKKDPPNTKK